MKTEANTEVKTAAKPRYIPVGLGGKAYERVKDYSEKTGIPITKVLDSVVNDWMDTVGAARLEAIRDSTKRLAEVIEIPNRKN